MPLLVMLLVASREEDGEWCRTCAGGWEVEVGHAQQIDSRIAKEEAAAAAGAMIGMHACMLLQAKPLSLGMPKPTRLGVQHKHL